LKVKAKVIHRMGEVLAATVHAGNPQFNHTDGIGKHPDGIDQDTSTRSQQLAEIPWTEMVPVPV
jgi:hypothetical protein